MIELTDLEFAYEARSAPVVRGVTATAPSGAVTVVVGPNAAGKTTLLRCAAGLLAPTTGQARLDGDAVYSMAAAARARKLAWVPQRPTVAARFTARDVVALGRFRLPPAPARIDAALDEVELADCAEVPFHTLSAGQQQRVAFARALAQLEPKGHLVLDEPTAAMDLRHAAAAAASLRRRAAEGVTVLLVLHDLAAAARLADIAWVMRDGRLVASGEADSVLTPPVLAPAFGVDLSDALQPLDRSLDQSAH